MAAWEKIKNYKDGRRKNRKFIKNGVKYLTVASFKVINFNKYHREDFPLPAAAMYAVEKNGSQNWRGTPVVEGGGVIEMHMYIVMIFF